MQIFCSIIYCQIQRGKMLEVLLLALALSADAFAISISLGIKEKKMSWVTFIKIALFFGLSQGLMPLLGYFMSVELGGLISSLSPWISFFILTSLGIAMFYDSQHNPLEHNNDTLSNRVLLVLALATSIDAIATGFTLTSLTLNPYISMCLIGVTTFLVSMLGLYIGTKGASSLESKAEKWGGIILLGIGIEILLSHLLKS